MKFNYIILTDNGDPFYTDIIYFNDGVNVEEVQKTINKVKEKDDYTNEDIYEELENIGGGIKEIEFLGFYDYKNHFTY